MYEYNLGLRFQATTERFAERTAIWFDPDNRVTYQALNQLANRMSGFLLERGIKPGDVVGISGSKTIYSFAAMLGCLKIGAAYTIFDPDSPAERLRKIFATCRPRLILAEQEFLDALQDTLIYLAILAEDKSERHLAMKLAQYSGENSEITRLVTGNTPAYIMYTSGSTGFPKGAVMTHANVLNLVGWSQETYRLTPEDITTNVNPLYFDNSVFDFYSALFFGACLVPFTKDEVRDPKRLVEKVDQAGCTLWFSVPSLLIFLQTMRATDGKYLRSIKRFIFGGEGYPKSKLKALYDTYKDTSEFFNVSGPTECTCICSSYKITPDDFADIQGFPSLGAIAANFSYLILDEDEKMAPEGELGELCLLGPNVGLGYYNDPERTAAAFVQNPYNLGFREIMYKTGDLVRLDPNDGKLYIHGRKDNQIKHMGYRVELEEIENALHRTELVSEAIAIHSVSGGLSRILAVVAVRKSVNDEQLLQSLRNLIPDYMIPSTFYYEDALPKNPNGKVDRKRLKEKYLALEEERRKK